ncbi:hypothetical protein N0V94_008901 [Neodidymelliopsis sp. IMI 364377]|nr:hypothetical protein N0V94_008901 [Neodidymelliopsis sp. IMI 364377]
MTSQFLPLIPWQKTSFLTAQDSRSSASIVQEAALDLFVLGYGEQANALLEALYYHGCGLEFDLSSNLKTLYDAWDAFDCTPSWILNPDPNKPFLRRDHVEEGKPLWDIYKDQWVNGLPESLRRRALDEGCVKVEELSDLQKQFEQQDRQISIGAVVQAAVLAGSEEMARSLARQNITELYRQFQTGHNEMVVNSRDLRKRTNERLGLDRAPRIWELLRDTNIGTELGVDLSSVEKFVQEGCGLIKQRFTEGCTRLYTDNSIAELVELLNDATMAKSSIKYGNDDEVARHLHPPATEEEIAGLERRLSTTKASREDEELGLMLPEASLPEDYKEFLRISNGFYTGRPDNPGSLFYGIEAVGTEEIYSYDFTLFDYSLTLHTNDELQLEDFTGFPIGAGGDEGQAVLVPPSYVKLILEMFEKAYAAADARSKCYYKMGALDTFGGLERLRSLEWLIVVSFHWDPEARYYRSFQDYLASCAETAIKERGDAERDIEKHLKWRRKYRPETVQDTGTKRKRNAKESTTPDGAEQTADYKPTNTTNDSTRHNLRTTKGYNLRTSKAPQT